MKRILVLFVFFCSLFSSAQEVQSLEYFVDSDPGEGLGTSIAITQGSSVSVSDLLASSALDQGFHTIYLRGKNAIGNWGHYSATTIFIESAVGFNDIVEISEVEYFVDTDPGVGLGIPITVTTAAEVLVQESIALSALPQGYHTLYLRGKLSGGSWGPYTSRAIYVETSSEAKDVVLVDALEYFVDSDPGVGLGIPLTVTPSSNVMLAEAVDLSSLSEGFHNVYLRGKRQNGSWGPYQVTTVYVEANQDLNDITEIEYFFDDDPGTGAALVASASLPSSLVEDIIALESASLSLGTHTVSVRARESSGAWGHYLTQSFEVDPSGLVLFTPNGNQVLTVGTPVEITWAFGGFPDTDLIEIRLSEDGGTTFPTLIADGTFSSFPENTFEWTPDAGDISTQGMIEVANISQNIRDTSDVVFTVASAPASITIFTPNGGEELTEGVSFDVTWEYDGFPDTDLIEIRLSLDGGATYPFFLADGTFATFPTNTFSWTPTMSQVSTNASIQVINTTQTISDESEGIFTINAATSGGILSGSAISSVGTGFDFSREETADNEDNADYQPDFVFTTNEGSNFGNEGSSSLSGTGPRIQLLGTGSINSITNVPSYTGMSPWIETSWQFEGTSGTPVSVGELWVVFTREGHYAIMEITAVGTGSFDFDYKYQPDGSTAFDGSTDTTPPSFATLVFSDASPTSIEINYELDEIGDLYFVAIDNGGTAPTTSEVLDPGTYGGAIESSGVITSTITGTLIADGLFASTTYDLYFVAVDGAGNELDPPASLLDLSTSAAATITIFTPNGGEELTEGVAFDVTWEYDGFPDTDLIEIRLSLDGGVTFPFFLADGTFATFPTNTFSWTPTMSQVSTNASIQVINTTQTICDESDGIFTINAASSPSITIFTPNGGEELTEGVAFDVTWEYDGFPDTDLIEIRLSLDGGATFPFFLADGTFATFPTNTFSWTPTMSQVSTNASIQVINTTQTISDESDGIFTISPATQPLITILTPNGGEEITVGEEYEITWTSENVTLTDFLEIRWSTNGGDSFTTIDDGTFESRNGSYTWTVPDVAGENNRIQIVNTTLSISDQSDANFSIVSAREVPFAFEAEEITSTSFLASWAPTIDAVSYRLDLSESVGFESFVAPFEDFEVSGTSQFLDGLDFSQSYFYRVRAVNSENEVSANSNVVTLKTVLDPTTTADSLALVEIFEALAPQGLNWASERLRNWNGVTLNANQTRVSALNISETAAAGSMPFEFEGDAAGGLSLVVEMDLSDNAITGLLDFSQLPIQSLDVSGNKLEFDDLEPVVSIQTLDYSNQVSIRFNEAAEEPIKIFHLLDPGLSITTGGSANEYRWFRNEELIETGVEFSVSGANLEILDVDFDNMGAFTAEVSSSLVPGLIIEVDAQEILAIADLTINVVDTDSNPLSETVAAFLLEATRTEVGFEVAASVEEVGSTFTLENVVLGNYLVNIDPVGSEAFISSYFSQAFQWIEADTLRFRNDSTITVTMTSIPDPSQFTGDGSLEVVIEEDFGDEEEERVDARRRAKKRKCGLRRRRTGGRVAQEDPNEGFELFAYGETDDNGQFKFGFLPEGQYRFFVEYPGIPVDPNADVAFTVGEFGISDTEFSLVAFATESGVEVVIDRILGFKVDHFKDLLVYPNPAEEEVFIEYRYLRSSEVVAELVDLTGQIKWQEPLTQGYDGAYKMKVNDYAPGIYILRFYQDGTRNEAIGSMRIVVK
ncbi:MAG: T9SS type A sorting domain-containing protein [Bacteroidota bacterium]